MCSVREVIAYDAVSLVHLPCNILRRSCPFKYSEPTLQMTNILPSQLHYLLALT